MPLRVSPVWTAPARRIAAVRARPVCHAFRHSRPAATPRLHARYESTVEPPPPSKPAAATTGSSLPPVESSALGLIEVAPTLSHTVLWPNFERNEIYKAAFDAKGPEIDAAVERSLGSPYVPNRRRYPYAKDTNDSLKAARLSARCLVGYDRLAETYPREMPSWSKTLVLLKEMTTAKSEKPTMSAIRVVLPKWWDLDMASKKVEFMDTTTGLIARLRMSADSQNQSAIILRGQSTVLASVGDDLIHHEGIEIFQLGEVAAFDYEEKQLWPVIEGAEDGGASLPGNLLGRIWAHKEPQKYWIDTPYEDTPQPESWTKDSFENYVTTLVCGRLRPHLAAQLYGHKTDTDGVRVKLLSEAFNDVEATSVITPSALKMALAFMAQRGGHRAEADRLFKLAEQLGIPLDIDTFNIILHGYVTNGNVRMFDSFLRKTKARYFSPNARTWLLFLELVKKDEIRRQVIVAMYETGLFEDPTTRRGIARIMAGYDAYIGFKAGLPLQKFMEDQSARYGKEWLTPEATLAILGEFFKVHERDHPRFNDFKTLLQRHSDGRDPGIDHVNLILAVACRQRYWPLAITALKQVGHKPGELEPDNHTYYQVIKLATQCRTPYALSVTVFYAIVHRMLRYEAKLELQSLLSGNPRDAWWQRHPPKTLSISMRRSLEEHPAAEDSIVTAVEWAVLREIGEGVPSQPLAEMLDKAWRIKDKFMHVQLKNDEKAGEAGQYRRIQGPIIPIADPAGNRWDVQLRNSFDPKTMVKGAASLHGQNGGEEEAQQNGPDSETEQQPQKKASPVDGTATKRRRNSTNEQSESQ